jgi:hypothetical protein
VRLQPLGHLSLASESTAWTIPGCAPTVLCEVRYDVAVNLLEVSSNLPKSSRLASNRNPQVVLYHPSRQFPADEFHDPKHPPGPLGNDCMALVVEPQPGQSCSISWTGVTLFFTPSRREPFLHSAWAI